MPVKIPSNDVKTSVSIAGIFVAGIWLCFNYVGQRMNHVYMQDAKKLVCRDELLAQIFENSLGKMTPSQSVGEYLSATMINYVFISGFIAAWTYVLLRPIG